MKATVIALALVLCAGVSSAQEGGYIGLFSDEGYSDCNLGATANTIATVYVVHHALGLTEANTSQFMLIHNWDNVVLSNVTYGTNLHLGDILTGVIVTYVGCKTLPHLIATLYFFPLDTPPRCTILQVIRDRATETRTIEVIDCAGNKLTAFGGFLCVNTSPPCCTIESPFSDCELPVATRETTWGGIKALYR